MHEVSGLRLLRVLRGQTLQDVAKAVDVQRSHISEVERDPSSAGRKLRQKLVEFHGCPWNLACATIDSSQVADAIVTKAKKGRAKNAQ